MAYFNELKCDVGTMGLEPMTSSTRGFPFSFEVRKQMLDEAMGDSIKVSKNYTFRAPFWRYLPPLVSPFSSLFKLSQESASVNLKNSIHRRVVEYQIKQLKNELAKFEE